MYSDVVIFVKNIEEIPNIVNNLMSNSTKMKEISQYNRLWIQQKVIIYSIIL